MENLLLSLDEQRVVLKFKNVLERKYKVRICLPNYNPSCEHDVVVATILGGKINLIKNFIQRRMNKIKWRREQRITVQNDVTTITLSDSDPESSFPVLMETQQTPKKRRQRNSKRKHAASEIVDLSSTILIEDSGESANEESVQKRLRNESPPPVDFMPLNASIGNTVRYEQDGETNSMKFTVELPVPEASPQDNAKINENSSEPNAVDDSIILSDSPPPSDFISLRSGKEKEKIPNGIDDIELTVESPVPGASPQDNAKINENSSEPNAVDDSIILSDSPQPPDFISLRSKKEKENIPNGIDDSVIIIDDEIPKPFANEPPRQLRPIVIDGSNVAREHGKVNNTFSCKGIKIAIDYFLQRGHDQVTAFVPQYRRHNKFGPILTTDQPLLEELSKEQRVVFTPSRRIDNKRVTCYDDRFIVELASKTNGVILSNDNYRDIADESEEFKKTINERLLMFCFVGDIIMIPQDPLGRNGPSLDNFLSFPN